MIAIWTVPGFSTQDGPTHLYNAWILSRSFGPGSPYQAYYQVRWQPLPNWAGHLALAGLVRVVSPGTADRIMITMTLVGFAVALVWLRWKVRGGEAMPGTCLLIVSLAPNFLWLLGFTSFLLGCCLLPITLGVWWSGRDHLGAGRLVALAVLVVLGYFCHLVSLGLTAAGLGILALFAPAQDRTGAGWESWFRRLGRTAASLLPLVLLGIVYMRLSRQGGPMNPLWPNLTSPDRTHGLGGASGLGRPAHAFEEGGAALHRSLERAVRRVRAGGLALRGGTVLPGGVNRGQPDREEAP